MSQSKSNIKVFPSFPETAFFSGEEFSCTLIFKNVAEPSPSTSSTSLTRLEGGGNGSRIVNSKLAGAEWMADSGRSASEGPVISPRGKKLSLHGRSMSTFGKNEGEKSRSPSAQKTHGRSKSVVISPTTASPNPPGPIYERPNPFDDRVQENPESSVFVFNS